MGPGAAVDRGPQRGGGEATAVRPAEFVAGRAGAGAKVSAGRLGERAPGRASGGVDGGGPGAGKGSAVGRLLRDRERPVSGRRHDAGGCLLYTSDAADE